MQPSQTFNNISGYMGELVHTIENLSRRIFTPVVLFILILGLGIFAGVWKFLHLPPG
jgi:hypothetical protein